MKDYIALILSIVSILISICSVIRIKPFDMTNDAVLGASLSIVSICVAVIVAYQIYNNITIERRLRESISKEYEEKLNKYTKALTDHVSNEMLTSKYITLSSLGGLGMSVNLYPIIVTMLNDSICSNNFQYVDNICSMLSSLHKNTLIKSVCGYEVYYNIEIRCLRKLSKNSDAAMRLLAILLSSSDK